MRIRTGYPKIGTSGQTLIFFAEDVDGTSRPPTSKPTAPTISINGGGAVTLPDPAWNSTKGYFTFAMPSAALSTDTVTYTSVAGWADSGVNGSLGAVTNGAVVNGTNVEIVPTVSGPQTMQLGYNVTRPYYFLPVMIYANCSKQASQLSQSSGTMVLDANGYPTSFTGSAPTSIVTGANTAPSGEVACPTSGIWTLKWDGAAGDVTLGVGNHCTPALQAGSVTGQATDNVRTYSISRTSDTYIQFNVTFAAAGATNVRIYPPGVATDGSQKFHPDFLTMLSGAKCLRLMDAMGTNGSNVVDYADYTQGGEFSYNAWPTSTVNNFTVTQVAASANAFGFNNQNRTIITMTTSAPHGLKDGQTVHLANVSTVINVNNGATTATADIRNSSSVVKVLSPTTFDFTVFYSGDVAGVHWTVNGTQGISLAASMTLTPGMPVQDMVELCNAVGADMHLCLPHAISDAAATTILNKIAHPTTGLAAGKKLYLELSNEHWNSAGGFWQWQWFFAIGSANGGISADAGYVLRDSQLHALAATALAAGSGNTLVRVFGGQWGAPSVTTTMMTYALAQGIAVDRVAVAPYIDAMGASSTTYNLTSAGHDNYTPAMAHDVWNMDLVATSADANTASNLANLQAKYPSAKLMCYEGGPQTGASGGTVAATQAANSRAWGRHPRLYKGLLYYFKKQQDSGADLFLDFTLSQAIGGYFVNSDSNWAAYLRYNQPAGKGDGSDGQFDNRTNYEDMDNIVSVAGLAIKDFLAMLSGLPAATAVSVTPPTLAGGVGVASVAFTVGPPAGTQFSGTVIVTPSDGASGGTFTPTSLSLGGTSTGTFTYTPGTVGTKTITITNDRSLTNPGPYSYVSIVLRTFSSGRVYSSGRVWSTGRTYSSGRTY